MYRGFFGSNRHQRAKNRGGAGREKICTYLYYTQKRSDSKGKREEIMVIGCSEAGSGVFWAGTMKMVVIGAGRGWCGVMAGACFGWRGSKFGVVGSHFGAAVSKFRVVASKFQERMSRFGGRVSRFEVAASNFQASMSYFWVCASHLGWIMSRLCCVRELLSRAQE